MTAEIINLRRARKAKNRREKDKRAEENRARFGLTKAERTHIRDDALRRQRALDGASREEATNQCLAPDQTDSSDDGEQA